MMSSGLVPHGEHAVERTCTVNDLTPSTRVKSVLTLAVSSTTTALTGSHPGTELKHFVTTSSTTRPRSLWFLAVGPLPYWRASEMLPDESGSFCAPARAAASACDWSERWAK